MILLLSPALFVNACFLCLYAVFLSLSANFLGPFDFSFASVHFWKTYYSFYFNFFSILQQSAIFQILIFCAVPFFYAFPFLFSFVCESGAGCNSQSDNYGDFVHSDNVENFPGGVLC